MTSKLDGGIASRRVATSVLERVVPKDDLRDRRRRHLVEVLTFIPTPCWGASAEHAARSQKSEAAERKKKGRGKEGTKERKKERKRREGEKKSLKLLGERFLGSGRASCTRGRSLIAWLRQTYTLKFKEYEVQGNKMRFCTFTAVITFRLRRSSAMLLSVVRSLQLAHALRNIIFCSTTMRSDFFHGIIRHLRIESVTSSFPFGFHARFHLDRFISPQFISPFSLNSLTFKIFTFVISQSFSN